ncbi:hypothetical protein [Allosalinactinospora lopnorensis]|uniref:hypothetical protein n=1 Tax=Allosalinactinospora lopnorensis TaxID=1352348 RepID=UPI000623DFDD|nr:hypothetical protein [Allosalinactinospora lopnorensis]
MPPPYPYQQPPRRNVGLIGGIAAGLVLLLGVGGAVLWTVMGQKSPYSALPDCDDLVTDEVTEIIGMRDPGIDEYVYEEDEFPEGMGEDVEEFIDCGVFADESEEYASSEFLAFGLSRHSTDTAEDDYAGVRGMVEARESGRDLDERLDEVTPPEPISAGDTGFQYIAEFGTDYGDFYGADGGSLSFVQYAVRNVTVTLWYRAPNRVPDEEKRDISLEVANEVERSLPEIAAVDD